MRILNTDSRNRAAVGRMSRDDGDARLRPFNRPPTTRIRSFRHGRACPSHPRLLRIGDSKTIGVGKARRLPSLRTVLAVLPHTALQSFVSSSGESPVTAV